MGRYTISKEFHFSASHKLTGLPEDHQCSRLHGHNYILKVTLSGPRLQHPGFILDYGELGFIKEIVDDLDHQHLNDMFNYNPTSENICFGIWGEIRQYLVDQSLVVNAPQTVRYLEVALSETPKTWASYADDILYGIEE